MEKVMKKGKLTDDHDLEMARYYLTLPPSERLAALERLREAYYGEDYAIKYRLSRSDIHIQRRPLREEK